MVRLGRKRALLGVRRLPHRYDKIEKTTVQIVALPSSYPYRSRQNDKTK